MLCEEILTATPQYLIFHALLVFQTTSPVLVRKDSPDYQVNTDCFPFFWSERRQPVGRRGREGAEMRAWSGQDYLFNLR